MENVLNEKELLEDLNKRKELIKKLEDKALIAKTKRDERIVEWKREKAVLVDTYGLPENLTKETIEEFINKMQKEIDAAIQKVEKETPMNLLKEYCAISVEEVENNNALSELNLEQDF